ncbi:MAG: hypothetical protein WCB15_27310 [Desulfobacterales bacterium]
MPTENDLILIYYEDNPLSFARIENILPDSKPDWYHVKLLLLQIPPQLVTWILRDVYIDGNEFTMNGKRMRLEKVVVPDVPESPELIDPQNETDGAGTAKVISLKDVKKK